MKTYSYSIIMLVVIPALLSSGCSAIYSIQNVPPTPTATFTYTPTIPPSPTPIPPTETPLPLPTDIPTEIPPTNTVAIPTTLPTDTPIPTREIIYPVANAKFEGSFPGGTLTFRVGDNGKTVIPKLVALRKAECKEGKKVSDTISFEPPPVFWLDEKGNFTMTQKTQVTISGYFRTPTYAAGSIQVNIKNQGKDCTIGPVNWVANAL